MNAARFFHHVQNAPWYDHFLNPVLEVLQPLPVGAAVLDVGTGPGKLIEMGQELSDLQWVGADVDEAMLAVARQRPALAQTPFYRLAPDGRLPFDDDCFDAVTFCSVLFLLPNPTLLLQEAMRVLRPNGRLIALTPTGDGRMPLTVLRQLGANPQNWTFFLWRGATSGRGLAWQQKETLSTFSRQVHAEYSKQVVFHGLATVEVIEH